MNYIQLKEHNEKSEKTIRSNERKKVLDQIQWHIYGRLWGINDLLATPPDQRTESAKDDKLKEAKFELELVEDLIKTLHKGDIE